jgi:hypothetical protein
VLQKSLGFQRGDGWLYVRYEALSPDGGGLSLYEALWLTNGCAEFRIAPQYAPGSIHGISCGNRTWALPDIPVRSGNHTSFVVDFSAGPPVLYFGVHLKVAVPEPPLKVAAFQSSAITEVAASTSRQTLTVSGGCTSATGTGTSWAGPATLYAFPSTTRKLKLQAQVLTTYIYYGATRYYPICAYLLSESGCVHAWLRLTWHGPLLALTSHCPSGGPLCKHLPTGLRNVRLHRHQRQLPGT